MKNRLNIILATGKQNEKNFACATLIINNIEADKVLSVSKISSIYDLAIICIEKILITCKGKNVFLYQHSDLLDKQKNEEYRNRLFKIQKGFVGKLDVLVPVPKCATLASQIKSNIDNYPLDEVIFPNKIGLRRSYPLYDSPQQKQYLELKTELLKLLADLTPEQQQNLLNYARGMAVSNELESKPSVKKKRA